MADIVDAYAATLDRALGRTRARVEVASELDPAEEKALIDVLGEMLEAEVVADFVANPDLLAGFRVRVGSKVFDGSLVGQLAQLRRQTEMEQG